MKIEEKITEILAKGVQAILGAAYDLMETMLGVARDTVGKTPSEWNGTVFNALKNLSDTAVVPIATGIMAIIICYDLIQVCVDKNNFKEFDTSIFFRFVVKAWAAIYLLNHTVYFCESFFKIGGNMATSGINTLLDGSALSYATSEDNIISASSFSGTPPFKSPVFLAGLKELDIGSLLTLILLGILAILVVIATIAIVYVVCIGRMIEMLVYFCAAPIPVATLTNKEWSSLGTNFIKQLLAFALQAFLIIVVISIYVFLFNVNVVEGLSNAVKEIESGGSGSMVKSSLEWIAYSIVCCFTLLKCGSISKSICGAH